MLRDNIRQPSGRREGLKKAVRRRVEEIKNLPRCAADRYMQWWKEMYNVDADGAITTVWIASNGPSNLS